MKVNEKTRKIIGKELHWLPALIPEDAEEFFVQLIDVNTLSLRPKGKTLHDGEWCSHDHILLIADGGKIVAEVGKKTNHGRSKWSWVFWRTSNYVREISFSESVERAIYRVVGAENVRYILQIESGSFSPESEFDLFPRVTLHKLPRRVPNLKTWLEQKAEEEATRLREKLAEADE